MDHITKHILNLPPKRFEHLEENSYLPPDVFEEIYRKRLYTKKGLEILKKWKEREKDNGKSAYVYD